MCESYFDFGLSKEQSDMVLGSQDLGDGEIMVSLDYGRVNEFTKELERAGYSALKTFSAGNTNGVLYVGDGGKCVYVYTNSGVPFANAVYGVKMVSEDNYIGEPLYEDTVFYQAYNDPDTSGGMTYLVRMKDGSFIVIDGGYNMTPAEMLKVMRRLHPFYDPAKPFEIAAWILSHPHDDHCQLLNCVMAEEWVRGNLNIRRICSDFSCDALLRERDPEYAEEAARARRCMEKLRADGCEVIKLHTGMNYRIGEIEMKVLYTAAEYACIEAKSVNDASAVFTLQSEGGKRIMMLSDMGEISGRYFMEMYKPEDIHADIVQIAHHALNGPGYPLYEAIGAKCYFWMINIRGYKKYASVREFNRTLREKGDFHFFSCFGESHIKI